MLPEFNSLRPLYQIKQIKVPPVQSRDGQNNGHVKYRHAGCRNGVTHLLPSVQEDQTTLSVNDVL